MFPARGLVVLAANPCPCGDYAPVARENRCTCPEVARREYRRKVSGPIADRVDVVRHLYAPGPLERDRYASRETSAEVRARVTLARERQSARYAGLGWRLNAQAPGHLLREEWALPVAGQRMVDDEVYGGRLTRRGAVRVHRLAWTLADLAAAERPSELHVEAAMALRTGAPLPLAALGRAS